jgi:hypothetical protein
LMTERYTHEIDGSLSQRTSDEMTDTAQ